MEDCGWKANLINALYTSWKSEEHTDLTIIAKGKSFKVHKFLLSSISSYFKVLLGSTFSESTTSIINLNYVEGQIMKIILTYIYSGKADLSIDNAVETLVYADYFQINDLKRLCCTFIKNNITSFSYLFIYETALKHSCNDLASFAMEMCRKNCSEVLSDPSFMTSQLNTLSNLFNSSFLNISSEDEVFEALLSWVNYKKDERTQYLKLLLLMVKESELDPHFQTIYRQEISRGNDSLMTTELCITSSLTSIRYRNEEKLLFVIGGESCGRILGNIECSSMENFSWRCSLPKLKEPKVTEYFEGQEVIRPLKYPRTNAAVACKNNIIYIIGGQANFDILSTCETYHIKENEWRDFVSLPVSLLGAQAAVLDDKLWVMGGTTQAKKCKEGSLLLYDEKRCDWCYKAPMMTDRVHFGAASVYGCLFVFGGIDISRETDGVVLNSCEKYSIESNKWIPIAPLGKGRAYHGVAVVNDLIYVIGGYNGSKWLDSVECYDPLSDRWTTVSPMMGCRSSFGVAVWNNRIYCMGGFNGESTLSTVMKYNPKTDMWHGVHNMHLKRYGLMVATVSYYYEKISRLKNR